MGETVDFAAMFDAADEEDEQALQMNEVLECLAAEWPNGKEFWGADVYDKVSGGFSSLIQVQDYFTFGRSIVSRKYVYNQLAALANRPFKNPAGFLTLRSRPLHGKHYYHVELRPLG